MVEPPPIRSASAPPALRARSTVERRKILRRALLALLGLGLVAVVVAFRLHGRHTPAPLRAIAPLPQNAQQAAAGYSVTHSEGGHEVFTVRAQRSTDLKNGEGTILDGVLVEVFGRTGDQHDLVKADRCEYKAASGDFSCGGPVAIELDAPRGAQTVSAPASASGSASMHGRHPVYINSSGLIYNQDTGLLKGTSHVEWRYGPAMGSAEGLAYATRDGTLNLDRDVTASVPVQSLPDSRGSRLPSLVHVSAAHLRYSKDQREIALTGPVHLTQGDRQADAGHATLDLDAQNRVTRIRLEEGMRAADKSDGGSRTVEAAALDASFDSSSGDLTDLNAAGDVRLQSQAKPGDGVSKMTADHAHVRFTGAHFHPAHGEASGNVHLRSEPAETHAGSQAGTAESRPGSSGLSRDELETADLEFAFRPGDATLEEAHTPGAGKITLTSADPKTGSRIITASHFQMAFDARSRLKDLRGLGPTQILFEPAAGAPKNSVAMESRGDNLRASLDPASGAVQSVEQAGHFQFIDADRHAAANRAEYSAGGDVLALNGSAEVTDPNSRLRADHIVLHIATNTAEGWGHVSSTHSGQLAQATEPGARGQEPGARATDDVTNVLADLVTADRNQQIFRYLGHVRAWRGADVIQAPELDIYRLERRIVADSGVVTSDLEPSAAKQGTSAAHNSAGITGEVSGPGPSPVTLRTGGGRTQLSALDPTQHSHETGARNAAQPVTIRADHFEYRDLEHKAAYRSHVRMDSSGATLECERLDAYFTAPQPAQPSQLDHAVADGHVILTEPGRRGSGNHADYFSREGKIVMTGGPPSLYDAEKGFTTGQSLTFFTHDDSLIIDGGSGFRALSEHHLSH